VTSLTSQSRDSIDDVTNRHTVDTFLYGTYCTRTRKSLSFRDIWRQSCRHTHARRQARRLTIRVA